MEMFITINEGVLEKWVSNTILGAT